MSDVASLNGSFALAAATAVGEGRPPRARRTPLILGAILLGACAPAPRTSPSAESPEWKPVSFALLEDYDEGESLHEVPRDFHLMNQLGVTTWRGSFGWDDYEPRPGIYDFSWLEAFAQLAADSGIALRPYIGYTPAWAAAGGEDGAVWNDPPADLFRWSAFVDTLVATLGSYDNILSWEIYNEVNVQQWWEGTSARYHEVLRSAGRSIRARNPDAEIVMAGLVWPDEDWMHDACTLHGNARWFDIAAFHAYPETWTPDSVVVESYLGTGYREGYLPVVRDACGSKPVWINEMGFATTPGTSEAEQASWWVRAVATFLAEPGIEHVGIYEIKDLPRDREAIGDEPNYHLGLTRADRRPKLAFRTIETLIELLDVDSLAVLEGELRVEVSRGEAEDLHSRLFLRPDGTRVLFVWDRTGSPTVEVELTTPGGEATVHGLDGSSSRWTDFDGRMLRGVELETAVPAIFRIEPERRDGATFR